MNRRVIEIKEYNGLNELVKTLYTVQRKNIFGKWKNLKINLLDNNPDFEWFEIYKNTFTTETYDEAKEIYDLEMAVNFYKLKFSNTVIKMVFKEFPAVKGRILKPVYYNSNNIRYYSEYLDKLKTAILQDQLITKIKQLHP